MSLDVLAGLIRVILCHHRVWFLEFFYFREVSARKIKISEVFKKILEFFGFKFLVLIQQNTLFYFVLWHLTSVVVFLIKQNYLNLETAFDDSVFHESLEEVSDPLMNGSKKVVATIHSQPHGSDSLYASMSSKHTLSRSNSETLCGSDREEDSSMRAASSDIDDPGLKLWWIFTLGVDMTVNDDSVGLKNNKDYAETDKSVQSTDSSDIKF